MNSKSFSRLSVGIIYRFDIKKALFSQAGALLGLLMSVISEGNPPFGDEPYRLLSAVTFFLIINVAVFVFTIIALGTSWIKLYPSMLIYTSRGKQTRVDFSRVVSVVRQSNKELVFYITDAFGKMAIGLKLKNYASYANAEEMLGFLKYLLKGRFSGVVKPTGRKKNGKTSTKYIPPDRIFKNQSKDN